MISKNNKEKAFAERTCLESFLIREEDVSEESTADFVSDNTFTVANQESFEEEKYSQDIQSKHQTVLYSTSSAAMIKQAKFFQQTP
ncbi:MAG: hypothetical protein ACOH1O_03790 [Flavobacterium sp.]